MRLSHLRATRLAVPATRAPFSTVAVYVNNEKVVRIGPNKLPSLTCLPPTTEPPTPTPPRAAPPPAPAHTPPPSLDDSSVPVAGSTAGAGSGPFGHDPAGL